MCKFAQTLNDFATCEAIAAATVAADSMSHLHNTTLKSIVIPRVYTAAPAAVDS